MEQSLKSNRLPYHFTCFHLSFKNEHSYAPHDATTRITNVSSLILLIPDIGESHRK